MIKLVHLQQAFKRCNVGRLGTQGQLRYSSSNPSEFLIPSTREKVVDEMYSFSINKAVSSKVDKKMKELKKLLSKEAETVSDATKLKIVAWALGSSPCDDNSKETGCYDYSIERIPVNSASGAFRYEYDPPLLPQFSKNGSIFKKLKERVIEKATRSKGEKE